MNFCNYCYTRLDSCADCHAAELAAKDKEIERLKAQIAAMRRCKICVHWDNDFSISDHCINCANTTTLPNWELAE
jgi:hypothetical protein